MNNLTAKELAGKTEVQDLTDSSLSFSLEPNANVSSVYWFSEFKAEALERTIAFQKNEIRFEGQARVHDNTWLLFVFLFCLALLAFVRSFHRKRFNLISKILFNWKLGKQIIRYEKIYTHPVNLALILIYLVAVPLFFAFCLNQLFPNKISLIEGSFWFFLFLLTYQLGKFFLYLFSAWLFEREESIKEYLFHVNLLSKFQGIAMLFLLVLAVYSFIPIKPLAWIGLGILGLSLILQLLRGIRIGLQKSKDLILIILYLCTLEILPLLVLFKWGLNSW